MRLGYKVGTRFLKSNIGQTFLIILGIAIGVSVQIFIGSLIQGLQKSLVEKTIGNSPQITISSTLDNKQIKDYSSILGYIDENEPLVENMVPVLDQSAFFEKGENSQSLLIRGFDIEQADQIYKIKDSVVEGTYPNSENEIILGVDVKEEYNLALNEEINLLTSNQDTYSVKIVGFFDLKVKSLNKSWGITTLTTAQEMFQTGDVITSIELQVDDDSVFTTDVIADTLNQNLSNDTIQFSNWKAENEQLLSGLQGQSISSLMIQIFVIISVVLGIASVLAITVMQKSKQIGILKAMGLKNSTTSFVFLFEGLILGFFGAILGILLGLGLSFAFTKFALNPDGTPVIALYISSPFILLSGLIAIASSVVAALVPAIRSSKLNPIDIIKNN